MSDYISPTGTPRCSVYKYYDSVGILIYVGITQQSDERNKQHNRDKSWWEFVRRQEVEHVASREHALARETALIKKFKPPFNKQLNELHREVCAAYMACRSAGFFDIEPRALLAQKEHVKIDLDVKSFNDGQLVVSTQLPDAVLAIRLRHVSAPVVRRGIYGGGGRVGHVVSITVVGPLAFISIGMKRDVVVTAAEAKLKQIQLDGGGLELQLRSVAVTY